MLHDLVLALRSLRRSSGTTLVAVLVLALGLAGATIVFSFVHSMVFAPFGIAEEEGWVRIFGTDRELGSDSQRLTEEETIAIFDRTEAFETIVFARNMGMPVTDAPRPLNPLMREVSEGWLEMMGVRPHLGRIFAPEEIRQGQRVAVVSFGFWQSVLGGDEAVVGRTIELQYEPWEVVGVLPAGYLNPLFGDEPQVVLPMPRLNPERPDGRGRNVVVARPRLDPEGVDRQLDRLAEELAREQPETRADRGFRAVPVRDSLVEPIEAALLALVVAVTLVLLIACANVTHLLLARALGRSDEMAIRRALGARDLHLVRLLLCESLAISFVAGALALLLTQWALDPLVGLGANDTPIPMLERVEARHEVLLFGFGLSLLTALLAGAAPIVRLLRGGTGHLSGVRTSRTKADRRLRRVLVVSEIALSVALVAGAGLALRSLSFLRDLPLGFEPENAAFVRTGARGQGFDDPAGWARFHERVQREIAGIPGVEAAGGIQFLPMFAAGFGQGVEVALSGGPGETEPARGVLLRATPAYFEAFGQPILRGREFADSDDENAEQVVIVSQRLARLLGPEPWIDRTLRWGPDREARIVGVAADLRGLVDDPEPPPLFFVPQAQDPTPNMTYLLRGRDGVPDEVLTAVEDRIWAITRDVPVYGYNTVPAFVANLEWRPRLVGQLLSGFALLALALAASGLYAVLSASVQERRRELGIRMALGADRRRLVGLVEGEAFRLALVGTGLGALGALGVGRLMASELQGVAPWDPLTLLSTAVILVGTSLAAAGIPAWRAARLDPVRVLRAE